MPHYYCARFIHLAIQHWATNQIYRRASSKQRPRTRSRMQNIMPHYYCARFIHLAIQHRATNQIYRRASSEQCPRTRSCQECRISCHATIFLTLERRKERNFCKRKKERHFVYHWPQHCFRYICHRIHSTCNYTCRSHSTCFRMFSLERKKETNKKRHFAHRQPQHRSRYICYGIYSTCNDTCHFRYIYYRIYSTCNVVLITYVIEYTQNTATHFFYRVAKIHRMPYLYRSFFAKEPYN